MNSFGVNLTGKKAIYRKRAFFKPNTTRETRTFICEGGPGCYPTGGTGILGLLFGQRTVTGRWVNDGTRDTLDIGQFEAYIDDNGKEIPNKEEAAPAPPTEIQTAAPGAPAVAPTVSTGESVPGAVKKAVKQPKADKPATPAPAAAAESTGPKQWDPARIVELFKGGMKIGDIAVEMGYERGQGNNRTKAVLKKAGLL